MVGLTDFSYWFTWFITSMFIWIGPLALCLGLITWTPIFKNSSYNALFLMYFFYLLTLVFLAFLISVFFNKAKTASVFGTGIVLVFSALAIVIDQQTDNTSFHYFMFLFSPICFHFGNRVAVHYENTGDR